MSHKLFVDKLRQTILNARNLGRNVLYVVFTNCTQLVFMLNTKPSGSAQGSENTFAKRAARTIFSVFGNSAVVLSLIR